ncbi:Uncharacterized membrane protein [Balnearium lithotrophicum]|uniref:Uncharacterized membrane protein n=1 Tax=Balnearium lithotrophicum TaxID=223788 RepID=A0A521D085_9BACT|nr:DUF2207 domain-containing protein [Balnearium lithotrophicum]SMO65078.1 Uncharacterized membrane protein [Balnearium lithotrophicum]
MKEKKYLIIGLILFSISSAISFYLTKINDLRLIFSSIFADYSAVISLDKEINLSEDFTYFVKEDKKFQMLYRVWRAPLTYREKINRPYIRLDETIYSKGLYDWYVKDFKGRIFGSFSNPQSKFLVRKLAEQNEVGMVNPNRFSSGRYNLGLLYTVFPPIESDGKFLHLNLRLGDKHIFYRKVFVEIDDPRGMVKEVFPHVTNWDLKRNGNKIFLTGLSPLNSIVGVELLLKPTDINGFFYRTTDVDTKTLEANKGLFTVRLFYDVFKTFLFIIVLLYPIFFYLFYLKFGREKEFLVPSFLSYVPNPKRKPYVVNLLFNRDALSGDENALFSTVLDFIRRGIVSVKKSYNSLVIEILKENEKFDDYERKVIEFFKIFGFRDDKCRYYFDLKSFKNRIEWWKRERNIAQLELLKKYLDILLSYENHKLTDRVLDRKGWNIFLLIHTSLLSVLIFLIAVNKMFLLSDRFFIDFYPVYVYSAALLFNFLLSIALFPSQFFGRWKEDFYREKLMWDAFKNFLSDLAMIKKYSPEDISIWKEWLVYGTALDVADKVEEALRELSISVPDLKELTSTRVSLSTSFSDYKSTVSSALTSSSSSSSRGGFGGGGAGAR